MQNEACKSPQTGMTPTVERTQDCWGVQRESDRSKELCVSHQQADVAHLAMLAVAGSRRKLG